MQMTFSWIVLLGYEMRLPKITTEKSSWFHYVIIFTTELIYFECRRPFLPVNCILFQHNKLSNLISGNFYTSYLWLKCKLNYRKYSVQNSKISFPWNLILFERINWNKNYVEMISVISAQNKLLIRYYFQNKNNKLAEMIHYSRLIFLSLFQIKSAQVCCSVQIYYWHRWLFAFMQYQVNMWKRKMLHSNFSVMRNVASKMRKTDDRIFMVFLRFTDSEKKNK